MTEYIFGIYGFDFSTRSQVRDLELIPLCTYPECRDRGQDKEQFLLTGYGRLPPNTDEHHATSYTETIRRIADGMTFCQQQYVLLTRPISVSAGDTIDAMIKSERLVTRLLVLQSRHTSGAIIGCDTFFPQSRIDFLERFLDHLGNSESNPSAGVSSALSRGNSGLPLTAALYRHIEIWRLSKPHVELEHFLAFSGLELLTKAHGYKGKAAARISGILKNHGLPVPPGIVQEWCSARGGLFHAGKLESTDKQSRKQVYVREQLYAITTLLADLSLKLLGFDDGHINWKRWEDRQPFR